MSTNSHCDKRLISKAFNALELFSVYHLENTSGEKQAFYVILRISSLNNFDIFFFKFHSLALGENPPMLIL